MKLAIIGSRGLVINDLENYIPDGVTEIVSGGATSSLIPLFDGVMNPKVNMLRIGAVTFIGPLEDIRTCYGRKEAEALSDECFILETEVIETNTKPTHPIGELGVDASGKVVREGSVPVDFEEARRQGGIRLGRYVRMNGYTCVSDDNYDLYRVLPKRDELWIRFDRGDYTQRSDRRLSVGNLKAIGPFFFLELHMDRTDVMAIYDLDSRRLVFTSTYSAQKDGVERYHTWGIPYERDGETLYLQPVMAERDLLVCRDRTEPDNYYIFRQK